jgi:hypothetical protein
MEVRDFVPLPHPRHSFWIILNDEMLACFWVNGAAGQRIFKMAQ